MELWDEKHPRSLILDQINSQQKIYILPKSIVVLLVNFVIIFPIFFLSLLLCSQKVTFRLDLIWFTTTNTTRQMVLLMENCSFGPESKGEIQSAADNGWRNSAFFKNNLNDYFNLIYFTLGDMGNTFLTFSFPTVSRRAVRQLLRIISHI